MLTHKKLTVVNHLFYCFLSQFVSFCLYELGVTSFCGMRIKKGDEMQHRLCDNDVNIIILLSSIQAILESNIITHTRFRYYLEGGLMCREINALEMYRCRGLLKISYRAVRGITRFLKRRAKTRHRLQEQTNSNLFNAVLQKLVDETRYAQLRVAYIKQIIDNMGCGS